MINTTWAVKATPLTHQQAALDKVLPSRVSALFMDMGTGKSLVTIMMASSRREKISKVVWCCPVSLKRNTRDQILLHSNVQAELVYLFDSKTTDANLPAADWYVVGLESIGGSDRVVMALNALVDENTMLVVDESSYIKGHRAKRTKRLILIGERARYRVVLNGTPISQGIEDLFTQMAFLSPKILGYRSWFSFSRAHLHYSERFKGRIDKRLHEDWLAAKIAPYVYQVTKSECLDLPEKTFSSRYVAMTERMTSLYRKAKERFEQDVLELELDEDVGVAIYRLFSALTAISNGVVPAGMEGDILINPKLDELIRVLHGIKGEPVVIWCRYVQSVKDVSAALAEDFPDVAVSQYYGELSERRRDQQLDGWRRNGGFLVATASCGGFGLTLTEARYAVFFSNSFKYSERLQAEDRIHRIGQGRNAHYINIWTECGIEERIETALARKGDALASFREEIEGIKQLGKDQIEAILRSL